MRQVALGIAVVAVLACGTPEGRQFNTTLTGQDGTYPLAVTVRDTTKLITAIGPGVAGSSWEPEPTVSLDPENRNVLLVSWDGGACQDETIILFWPEADGYHLMLTHRGGPGIGGGCVGAALPRVLRITTATPVATDRITIVGSS